MPQPLSQVFAPGVPGMRGWQQQGEADTLLPAAGMAQGEVQAALLEGNPPLVRLQGPAKG